DPGDTESALPQLDSVSSIAARDIQNVAFTRSLQGVTNEANFPQRLLGRHEGQSSQVVLVEDFLEPGLQALPTRALRKGFGPGGSRRDERVLRGRRRCSWFVFRARNAR